MWVVLDGVVSMGKSHSLSLSARALSLPLSLRVPGISLAILSTALSIGRRDHKHLSLERCSSCASASYTLLLLISNHLSKHNQTGPESKDVACGDRQGRPLP